MVRVKNKKNHIDNKWENAMYMYSYKKENEDSEIIKKNGLYYVRESVIQLTLKNKLKKMIFYIDPRKYF